MKINKNFNKCLKKLCPLFSLCETKHKHNSLYCIIHVKIILYAIIENGIITFFNIVCK